MIEREGLIDEGFIRSRTTGWDELKAVLPFYTPEKVGEICGLEPALIEKVGSTWGRAGKAMAFHARGIEHHIQGVDNCLSVINLCLATGQIGAPGQGIRHHHRAGQRPGRPGTRAEVRPACPASG